MTKRIEARESVGYRQTWTIGGPGAEGVDIGDWTFSAVFQRQAGAPDFTLGMAASVDSSVAGFFVISGSNRQVSVCIPPAVLQAIADTTSRYQLAADLIGTPPGDDPVFIKSIILTVTQDPPHG
jgi:hypothetical protein